VRVTRPLKVGGKVRVGRRKVSRAMGRGPTYSLSEARVRACVRERWREDVPGWGDGGEVLKIKGRSRRAGVVAEIRLSLAGERRFDRPAKRREAERHGRVGPGSRERFAGGHSEGKSGRVHVVETV